jgi:DNA-binding Lrp family transcriptional regulator
MPQNKIVSDEDVIQALEQTNGNISECARRLGIVRSAVRKRRDRLAKRGLWNNTHAHLVPDGYQVKGKSVLYRPDGSEVITWVKSDQDKERQVEMMREVVNSFIEQLPRAEPIPPPEPTGTNLLNLYIITDYHLGMMAWGEETGQGDWDLSMAISLLKRWIDEAVARAPVADMAIMAQMGDFMHWDGMDAVTPTSRHTLDADTRFSKVARAAIVLQRYCINKLLTKYQRVRLIQTGGNHDPASTVWLREMFSTFYSDDPRVEVDLSPELYYCHEWGKVSNFFTHGHKRNMKAVAETFVTRFRDSYGRTEYSYGHTGHKHSDHVIEMNGIRIEQHRTLSPPDAYSATSGYSSGRDSKVITYHKEFGEVSRLIISPQMLQ